MGINFQTREKPRLIQIFNSFGYPTLLIGYPSRVGYMLMEAYGVLALTKMRIL